VLHWEPQAEHAVLERNLAQWYRFPHARSSEQELLGRELTNQAGSAGNRTTQRGRHPEAMDGPTAALILIIDDEPDILQLIAKACEREGLRSYEAATATEGLRAVESMAPDLVILDLSLPDGNGLDVCREIRHHDGDLPIIMVTAKGEETDKVVGLELGADDYVTKPFSVRELIARVRANLRKSLKRHDPPPPAQPPPPVSSESIRVGPLRIWLDQREVKVGEEAILLTRTEFDILRCLAENVGRVLTRDQIVSAVWGYQVDGSDRLVDAHVRNLRRKIEHDPRNPELIATVRQIGYRMVHPT
jgi:two-component system alkaline phosphatase synthesis response regulator PhoP